MPNISKERLDKIKKSYDSVSKPIGDEINGFHLDMMVNTIKEMWKNDISQYNPDPEDLENAKNSTIAYYLAMKNFETTLEGKLPDNFNEYLEDMEDVYNNTVDIPEKQLNAIGKNLNKKPEDYENVGYIEENGSTRTMADLRSENTSKEYEKYTEIFNDAFEKIKDRKGKEVIIETKQVSKLRNPSIVITNDDIKDAIEFSNLLDSKKSTKELVDTKNSEVGKINKLVDKAKSNINKNIQNYASDILLNNKEMDANAQIELKDSIFALQKDQQEANKEIFKQKCGTYLKSKEKLDSHGMLYKFFLRSAYNKEKALVESMKDDLKNSYHLTDNEISQIENSRKDLNDKKLDEDAKIIDKDIRIDTTNNKRVESDEYAKEENDLLNDVSENKFYEDLAVAVNENIYQRTSEFVDGKKNSSPKKDLDK